MEFHVSAVQTSTAALDNNAQRNRLDRRQTYNLTQLLEKKLPEFAANMTTSNQAAEILTKELGFTVNQRNVLGLAGMSQEAIFKHQWPNNLAPGSGQNHAPRSIQLLTHVLDMLVRQTGLELDDQTRRLWDQMVAMNKLAKEETPNADVPPQS
jgi:hypothetical protein